MASIGDFGTSAYVRSEVVAGFHGEERQHDDAGRGRISLFLHSKGSFVQGMPQPANILDDVGGHDDAIRIQHGGRGPALTDWRGASETR